MLNKTTGKDTLRAVSDRNSQAYEALASAMNINADSLTIGEAFTIGRSIQRALWALDRLGRDMARMEND